MTNVGMKTQFTEREKRKLNERVCGEVVASHKRTHARARGGVKMEV